MNIIDEINQLNNNIIEIRNKIETNTLTEEEFDTACRQIFKNKLKIQNIEKEIYKYKEPDIIGNEIDLYLANIHELENKEKLKYLITIHNKKEYVGEMEIRLNINEANKNLGNIGAHLLPEYKGKRYSKQAFTLLKDVMLGNGLSKPIFTVRPDNIPSIKSLDNIGAKQVDKSYDDEGEYLSYEYDLNNIK